MHAQTTVELAKRVATQQREIEGLRTAIQTQGVTLRYLSQSDSAGLYANPFVQRQVEGRIDEANEVFVQRTTLWIAALIATCMGLVVLLIATRFGLLKRIRDIEYKFTLLRNAVDEDAVARERHTLEQQEARLQQAGAAGDPFSPFTDHALALRVADEVHRMRKRLSFMDEDTTGLTALKHSLKRLEEQLNDGGYELIDLAGKKYVDGLNVEARFVPDETGSAADETITDTIRPQVNYMGAMIQQAKVEVSKSYS